jgi:hypothetical protein
MPLARYFLVIGGALLALLLIANACLPMLPVAIEASSNPVTIRIHSEQKLPERVVFDTSLPTIVPQKIASAELKVPDPAITRADVPIKAPEDLAQLRPSDAVQLRASDPRRREVKQQHQRKPAKKRKAPHEFMMARPAHYGWFGYGTW